MHLTPGTKFGPYEILSPLGAGGMGEVYRARDTRLGRDVAIKVLPQHLSSDSEVRARFEREAKTVSSLNHPNICVLYDVGREGDTDYLVMELVDGETLATRIARGPLPMSEVLKIGAQIADALDRAHRAGVVHRDLKPGNVMLAGSGAKLMDFGLARAVGLGAEGSATMSSLTRSPTVAEPLTAEGTILGTFQYMAPEQLEGREADARSDLWALGCVLYEMATGRRAFEGKSQASLIASIMHADPRPVRELQPSSPAAFDRIVRECLAVDPEERRQSAGDLRRELNRIARGEGDVPSTSSASSRRRWMPIGAAAVVLAAAAGFFLGHRGSGAGDDPGVAFTISPPPGGRFRFTIEEDGTRLAPPVISPDGRRVVFGVVDETGKRELFLRSLDDTEMHPIPGTTDARFPFWSPDGQSLGFFSDGKLRTVSLVGGVTRMLADQDAHNPRGADWGRTGTILYAPSPNAGIFAVPAGGGAAVQVTFPDTTLPDISHRYPSFLPDDEHFVFLVWTNNSTIRETAGGLYLGSIHSREVQRIETAPSNAVCVDGAIVFAREGNLYRGTLDIAHAKMTNVMPVNQRVDWDPSTGLALFDISDDGTLVCRETGALAQTRLVWFNRAGEAVDTVGTRVNYRQLAVARDGRTAVASIGNTAGDGDVWIIDFARGLSSRFTNSPADEADPTPSADGRGVAYTSDRDGPYHCFVGPRDRSTPPEKFSPPAEDWNLLDWSSDGRYVLMATATDLWVADLQSRRAEKWHPVPGSLISAGCFSPDSRWIAYGSSESGRDEIYVRPYPGPGGQWQVSTAGGLRPHWSNGGREIVYVDLDGDLMAVQVDTRSEFRPGAQQRLFRVGPRVVWAATGDHSRFLVAVRGPNAVDPPLKVVTRWTETTTAGNR